jgi:hypothetical protein
MKRTYFKRKPQKPLKRSRLRFRGVSDTDVQKERIQALLRQIAIKKWGGCILRGERDCGGEVDVKGVVLQADHLITRAYAETYADSRLVVCVCRPCHFWKKHHKEEYDDLVKIVLPEDIVKLWEECEQERRSYRTGRKQDWAIHILALEKELEKMQ